MVIESRADEATRTETMVTPTPGVDDRLADDIEIIHSSAPTARQRNRLSAWVSAHATPLAAFLWSRVLVVGAAVVSVAFINRDPASGPWPRLSGPRIPLLQAFARWDGAWYLDVAVRGYSSTSLRPTSDASFAFFPGFPVVVRAIATVTHVPAVGVALALNFALGIVCAVVVWRLVRRISGTAAADRAVTLFCFAPAAFILSMAYSEPLFIAATAACLLLLIRREWLLAGIAGAAATGSRPTAVAVILTCVITAIVAVWTSRDWKALLAPALAPVGVLAYFAYLWARTGSPTKWFAVQRSAWDDYIAPVAAMRDRFDHVRAGNYPTFTDGGLNDLIWVLGVLVGIGCIVLLVRWNPPVPVLVYGLSAAGFALASHAVGLRPRMLLTAFPLVLAVGVRLDGWKFRAVAIASGTLLTVLAAITFSTFAAVP